MKEQLIIDILFYFLQMAVYPALWYIMLNGMLEPKFNKFITIVIPALLNSTAAVTLLWLNVT